TDRFQAISRGQPPVRLTASPSSNARRAQLPGPGWSVTKPTCRRATDNRRPPLADIDGAGRRSSHSLELRRPDARRNAAVLARRPAGLSRFRQRLSDRLARREPANHPAVPAGAGDTLVGLLALPVALL